jgi:hypothetical protein
VVPPADRQAVRNNLVAAEQAFTESLRGPQAGFVYHIHQADVNRWLAMRKEIYPLIDELAPPQLGDPFLIFDTDRIILAGRYAGGGVSVVISIELSATFAGGEIVLRLASMHCGALRVPVGLADLGLDVKVDRPRDATWPGSPRIHGSLLTGLHVGAEARWKNGGVRYRVRDFSAGPGRLDLTVESLGRDPPTGRSHQP